MADVTNRFHIADFVVFGATVIISIGIGIFYAFSGGKQKTTSEFLLGGRLISYIPVAISLMVSFESSIMMLGIPAEGYVYGMQFLIGTVGFLISQLLSINLLVPLLHPLKITSAYEYLEFRFNSKAVRLLGTVLGMLTYCWYMGIVLFGPAVALEAVTGFPRWTSIVVISMVAVIYTSIGGLKAVVWTDVFQAFVMFAGIFAILIKGTIDVGGSQEVWNTVVDGGRANFFVFDFDPRTRHTFFNLLFSSIIRGFGLAFNQSTVQRISSTKSVSEAKKVMMIVAPAFTASFVLAMMEGMVAYAYYVKKECDPFESNQLTNPNQIMPFFVMDVFNNLHGMPGLFLASLFSASLSTLSSGLSSLSALLWADIVHPLVGDISEFKGTLIAKISVLAFGVLACGLAFLVSMIGGTLIQIASSVLSAFGGPVTGLFMLGCFCHRSNSKGAFWGALISLVLTCWLSFGMNFSSVVTHAPWLDPAPTDQCFADDSMINKTTTTTTIATTLSMLTTTTSQDVEPSGIEVLYTLSYTWIAPFGIISTMILGYIISLLTGPNKPGDVDPRYLLEVSGVLFIFMPSSVKKWASSQGTQFIKEEYKSRFPDPALRDKISNTEMTIHPETDKGLEGGEAGEPLLLSMTSHAERDVTVVDGTVDNKINKNDCLNNNVNGFPASVIITDEKNKANSRNSNGIVVHMNTGDEVVKGEDKENNSDDDNADKQIHNGGVDNDNQRDNDDNGDDDSADKQIQNSGVDNDNQRDNDDNSDDDNSTGDKGMNTATDEDEKDLPPPPPPPELESNNDEKTDDDNDVNIDNNATSVPDTYIK